MCRQQYFRHCEYENREGHEYEVQRLPVFHTVLLAENKAEKQEWLRSQSDAQILVGDIADATNNVVHNLLAGEDQVIGPVDEVNVSGHKVG